MAKKLLFLFCLSSFTLSSCLEKKVYPDEPIIEFKSMIRSSQTAELTISFTDGDGNFGLEQKDTLPPFCPDTCEFYYNLFMEYQEKQNGVWTTITLDPDLGQIPFYYRIPLATPSGQFPSQIGEISIDMPVYYLASDYDTCRFEIVIYDKQLNKSNIVYTDVFIKP